LAIIYIAGSHPPRLLIKDINAFINKVEIIIANVANRRLAEGQTRSILAIGLYEVSQHNHPWLMPNEFDDFSMQHIYYLCGYKTARKSQ
jgi:hypothetical protein